MAAAARNVASAPKTRTNAQPAEDRLADQARGGPRSDDHPERLELHAMRGEVQRHDREQRPEAEPHDQLRREEREDRLPATGPGDDPGEDLARMDAHRPPS